MLTIGLTGGSGAGKGEVSAILQEMGIPTIDTDAVYRGLAVPGSACLREIVAAFGAGVLSPDGYLDRRALAEQVFGDLSGEKLNTLNKITHKYILEECRRQLAMLTECGHQLAVVDAPQLYESRFNEFCDAVIAVTAARELRVARIMKRDGIEREAADDRICAQHDDTFFAAHADYLIENNGSKEELSRQVRHIVAILTDREEEEQY